MTGLDDESQKHVHKQEDYAALDGKDLSPEMLDGILTNTENGLPLTDEQSEAIGSRWRGEYLVPRDGVRWTEAQIDAFFGGREERIRKSRRFTKEMLPHTIKELEGAIASGKRYKKGEYGERISLRQMLEMARKELHLLTTTNMPLSEIEKVVVETVHVRAVYLIPRLGEMTIAMPGGVRSARVSTIQQKGDVAIYHRLTRRWKRLDTEKFEYIPPVPEWKQPNHRGRKTSGDASAKKTRKRKAAIPTCRLGFYKRVSIDYSVRIRLGEQPRDVVNAHVGEHRAIIRERLKAGELPQNKTLVTLHPLEGLQQPITLVLASYIRKSEWRSSTDVTFCLKTVVGLEEHYEELLKAVDTLSLDRGNPPEEGI